MIDLKGQALWEIVGHFGNFATTYLAEGQQQFLSL